MTRTYRIDGARFSTLDEFYDEVERVFLDGGPMGHNLNAFADILRGGFGTPEDGFVLRWERSALSRGRLGYEETVRQLRARLATCHPGNRAKVAAELREAEEGRGPTVFDWLVEIIRELNEMEDLRIDLVLE